MNLKTLAITAVGAFALALPADSKPVEAAETQYLRIATLAPRDSDMAKGFMKLDKGMKQASGGAWGVRLYPSGVAGDEPDVLRKMKIGQMDASLITSVGLSQILRETTLLSTPGVVQDAKGWERVRKEMTPEWDKGFEKAGYKLLAWGESGSLRMFAKDPLDKPSAVKKMRPWLWPAAHAMKETWLALGANGVPLGVPEVYGALQTGMVDAVINSCLTLVALQWHTTLKHMTADASGVLIGGMLMSDKKWAELPPDVQKIVSHEVAANQDTDADDMRKTDERAFQNLIKRGYTAHKWKGVPDAESEMNKVNETVQKRLIGRMYTAEQLERVKKIANGG
ncbi:MAG TPA: TRAP transporter substrate-binding protein DctP [Polyangiales bacterium]|nr:TRAP transporter substrate-binding protein DctP [Polyangiales bacterium]